MAAIPQHSVNIYQKPRLGAGWLAQFNIFNYSHRLLAMGGCDSARFVVMVDFNQAEWLFENCIGNSARIYVDDPVEPIFDGYISRITYRIGGVDLTRGIEDMFNDTSIMYYNTATATTQTSATVDTPASVALYMRKHGTIDGDIAFTGATTQRQNTRTLLRDRSSWPLTSMSAGQGTFALEIEMRGWYTILDWLIYTNALTTTTGASVLIREMLADTASATLFENAQYIWATGSGAGTWSDLISFNSSNCARESSNQQTYLEFLEGVVLTGAAGTPRVQYAYNITKYTGFDPNTNGRRVYYAPARIDVYYYQRARSEPGVFRDAQDRKIDPWRIEADRAVQVTDVLFGWGQAGNDPRVTYIEAVDYSANEQTVTYTGSDDITVQGVFGLRARFKVRGRGGNRAPVRWRT